MTSEIVRDHALLGDITVTISTLVATLLVMELHLVAKKATDHVTNIGVKI